MLHLQTELGSKAQTKLEMMLDEMEPMKFHEILHFENLLKLDDHLEFQYDISQEMDTSEEGIPASKALFFWPVPCALEAQTVINTFDLIGHSLVWENK